jgi:hypothetical protein
LPAAEVSNASGDPLGQVAVRVDHGAAEVALDVLERHCFDQCRLAGTRLPDGRADIV